MDRTCDFAKVVQGLSGVHGDEVTRHVVRQTLAHRLKCGVGSRQRFKVTKVGDDQLMPLVVGLVGRGEQVFQGVDALSL